MAISNDALQAIAAKMRGHFQEEVKSTTSETTDALKTYKEDVKTMEKNAKKEKKKKPVGGAKKVDLKKKGKKETVKKKTERREARQRKRVSGKRIPRKKSQEKGRKRMRCLTPRVAVLIRPVLRPLAVVVRVDLMTPVTPSKIYCNWLK